MFIVHHKKKRYILVHYVYLSVMSPPIQPYHSTRFFNEKGGTSAQQGIWVEGPD